MHLTTLVERERSRLFEQTGRQADLSYVVNKPTEVRLLLLVLGQTHALRDVARVDRDRGRVSRGVLISCVERRHQGRSE